MKSRRGGSWIGVKLEGSAKGKGAIVGVDVLDDAWVQGEE